MHLDVNKMGRETAEHNNRQKAISPNSTEQNPNHTEPKNFEIDITTIFCHLKYKDESNTRIIVSI